MASYDTDEEQIEAFKRWWKDNGNALIIGVIIALAVLFGARQWQTANTAKAELASDLYQQLADLAVANLGSVVPDEDFSSASEVYTELKNNFANSVYSRFGALMMARLYVDRQELDSAAVELQWVLDNPDLGFFHSVDEELFLTARLRLARVIIAQGEAQQALDLLNEVEAGTMVGAYSEVKGDAYMALGNNDEARKAYQIAIALTSNPALIQLKLDNLAQTEGNSDI